MKRLLSIFMALVLCLSAAGLTAFADDYEEIYLFMGDVNGDEWVDNNDAVVVLKYDVGLIDLTEDELLYADVNYDGVVDNTDATLILKYDAGIIYDFCEEHIWVEGCTTGKYCEWCYLVEEEAEGHKIVDGACTNCAYTEARQNAFDEIVGYIEAFGIEEEGIYSVVKMLGDTEAVVIMYDPMFSDTLMFAYTAEGETASEMVMLEWTTTAVEQEALFMLMSETAYDMGYGAIDIATFNAEDPTIYGFESSSLTASEQLEAMTLDRIVTVLTEVEAFLTENGLDCTMADLGYTAF